MYKMIHLLNDEGKFVPNKVTSPLENSLFRADPDETSLHSHFSQLNLSIQQINIDWIKNITARFKNNYMFIEQDFNYTVDNLRYLGTVICKSEMYNGDEWMSLNIKLSNDGFLHSARNVFNVIHDNIHRHKHDKWCTLSESESNQLYTGKKLADEVLGGPYKTQLFYNEHVNRVDLKFINLTMKDSLCITFEPGYPKSNFDDLWW